MSHCKGTKKSRCCCHGHGREASCCTGHGREASCCNGHGRAACCCHGHGRYAGSRHGFTGKRACLESLGEYLHELRTEIEAVQERISSIKSEKNNH